jgi:hypothetical protein
MVGSQRDDSLAIGAPGLRRVQGSGRLLQGDAGDRRRGDAPVDQGISNPFEELARHELREVKVGPSDPRGGECAGIGDVFRRDGGAPGRTSAASAAKPSASLTRSMRTSMPSGCACCTAPGSETWVWSLDHDGNSTHGDLLADRSSAAWPPPACQRGPAGMPCWRTERPDRQGARLAVLFQERRSHITVPVCDSLSRGAASTTTAGSPPISRPPSGC